MAKVVCPACKQMNSFPAIEAGAELVCQHCNQPFRVRGPGGAPAKPTPPTAATAPTAALPKATSLPPPPTSAAPIHSPLQPLAPLTPLAPLPSAPAHGAPPFAQLASPDPFGSAPQASPFGQPAPFGQQAAASPFTPLAPLSPLTPLGPQPSAPSPFAPLPAPKPWNPPPAAGPPRGNSNVPILLGVLGFFAVVVLFCGGAATLFYMNVKSKVVAAADRVKEENDRRQKELEREMQREMNARLNQRPVVPQPPTTVRKKTSTKSSSQPSTPNPPASPLSPPLGTPSNPEFTPPIPPTPFPNGPQFPPPGFPPGVPPGMQPPIQPPTPSTNRKPRTPAVSDDERLTQVLADLKDPQPSRPPFITMHELERIPVQESRRAEVATAIETVLKSSDPSASRAALRAVAIWGTETNVATLTSLVSSGDYSTRSEAIRALAKVSKTEATAEVLAAKLEDFSNLGALREAFKELGPVGEPALLKRVDSSDRRLRTSTHMILVEIGGKASQDALEDLIKKETDTGMKMMAESTLRRMKSRKP